MDANTVIDIKALRVDREKGGTRFVLAVPAFTAERGAFVAVTGPSGCGKSTFLDVLGLVLTPNEAERFLLAFPETGPIDALTARGNDALLSRLRRRHIGAILQTGGLLPFLTVLDNIVLPSALCGFPEPEAATALARELGIADQLHKMPDALSGGQRQRAAIARALLHAPDLVLADEPTAAVDRPAAVEIMKLLRTLARERQTLVLLVTHDHALADAVADRQVQFRVSRLPHGAQSELIQA